MSLTTVLAIWGAVLSTGLGAFKAVEFWRDRPHLGVEINLDALSTHRTRSSRSP